ncbi:MAG: glycoside hydrolase [Alphaproteobacteria bacterium]|nr:MAG: glycoside hydrolase [Alphaproteobacteria bacterium]
MNSAALIKKHEGYSETLYECTAGKSTIGFGRNIEQNGINLIEAELMLHNDMMECERVLSSKVGAWQGLSEQRQGVLVNMMYNLGWPRLSGFKNMLKAVEALDFDRAAIEMMDSRWAHQVGNRAKELCSIMKTNKWSD